MMGCWRQPFGRPDTGSPRSLAAYAGDGFAEGRDTRGNPTRRISESGGGRSCGSRQFRPAPETEPGATVDANAPLPRTMDRRRRRGMSRETAYLNIMINQRPDSHDDCVNEKDRCANTSPLQRSLVVWAFGSRLDRRQTA